MNDVSVRHGSRVAGPDTEFTRHLVIVVARQLGAESHVADSRCPLRGELAVFKVLIIRRFRLNFYVKNAVGRGNADAEICFARL